MSLVTSFADFFVTKGSAASDDNGGGPSLGTNDGPVVNVTNATSDVAGTTVSSVSGWTGASVDDWICFDPGGAHEYAKITNISGNDLTVSPAVSGSQSGITVNVGGAWATIEHGANTLTTGFGSTTEPPFLNVKYEGGATYSESSTVSFNAGTGLIPIFAEGYITNPRDIGWDKDTDTEYVQVSVANTGMRTGTSWNLIRRFHVTTSGNNNHAFSLDAHCAAVQCIGTTVGTSCHGFTLVDTYGYAIDCEADASGTGSNGFNCQNSRQAVIGCRATDCGADGFTNSSYGVGFISCIAENCTVFGFHLVHHAFMVNCVAHDCGNAGNNGAVFGNNPTTYLRAIVNSIFEGSAESGIEHSAGGWFLDVANAFNETTEYHNLARTIGWYRKALTGTPFTSAGSPDYDYSLNDTAGAGAECRDTGIDGEFEQ